MPFAIPVAEGVGELGIAAFEGTEAVSATTAVTTTATASTVAGTAGVLLPEALSAEQAAFLRKALAAAMAMTLAATAAKVCQSCNPCAVLAAGLPGSKYRGGSHAFTSKPAGDGLDSHHTPAAAASPLPRDMGPAIQMDPADHWRTASNGRMPGSAAYIAAQRTLISNGNFMGAVAMDDIDVHTKFGSKYDSALLQMTAYALCLKKFGLVN